VVYITDVPNNVWVGTKSHWKMFQHRLHISIFSLKVFF